MSEEWIVGVVICLVICSAIGAAYFINEISVLTDLIKRNEEYTQQELDRLDLELRYQKGSLRRYIFEYDWYSSSSRGTPTVVYSYRLTDALRKTKGHVKFVTEQFKLEGKTYSNTYDSQLRLIEEPNGKENGSDSTGQSMFCSGL